MSNMIGGALGSRRELLTQDECVARNPARLVVALTVMLRLTGLVVDLFCGVATATAPGPPPCFYKRGFLLSLKMLSAQRRCRRRGFRG